jgi:uncharacterized membrane protein YraQ (UPF0718 family)
MLYLTILLQRFVETLQASLPTLLAGLLIAAMVRVFCPPSRTRRLLLTRDDGTSSHPILTPVVAVLWGVLLPVCSLGIIPILLVTRRAGTSRRALAGLALSGGFINPYTMLSAMGYAAPWKVALVVSAGLLAALLAGIAAGERPARTPTADPPEETPGRLVAVPVLAGRIFLSGLLIYALLTAVAASVLAVALPPGFIGHLFTESDPVHVLLTAAIAVPAYVPPALVAMQSTEILWQRTDPGAALLWWMVGGGLSVGMLLFLPRVLGYAGTIRALGAAALLLVSLAFALSPVLRDGPVPSDDSHAFDRHNQPYHHALQQHGNAAWLARQLALLSTREAHLSALVLLLLTLTVALPPGLIARSLAPRPPGSKGRLPGWAVVGTLVVGSLALAVSLLYTRYPSPTQTFQLIRHPDAELFSLLRTGEWDATRDPLQRQGALLAQLGPGAFLRRGVVPAEYSDQIAAARALHATLADAVARQDAGQSLAAAEELTRTLRRAERAWSPPPSTP